MITLKPQWSLRKLPDGRWTLTSENYHQEVLPEYAAILQKLVQGVEPNTLTDAEFDQLEYLTDRGFLSVDTNPDAPAWELSGANFHSVQEQFKHVTFSIVDQTTNGVGESLRQALLSAGMKEATDSDSRITFAVSDSYLTLPNVRGNMLPIVCNRMRVSVGPMVFPWGVHVRDEVAKHEHYLPKPGYVLPQAFDALQRAWIAVAVLQFIGTHKLRYVGHFVEYDMAQQEFKLWPIL
jgi:hypothetical protein